MLYPNASRTRPRISSPFGNRWHPVSKKWKMHRGADCVGFTTIHAIAAGTVYKVGTPLGWSGGGTQVWIKHDDGSMSRSLHLVKGSTLVVPNQRVREGQAIGRMGMTGTATGVHLHLELVVKGKQIDPLPYIAARLTIPAAAGGAPSSEGDEFMAKIDDLWQAWLPGKAGVKTAGEAYLLFVDILTKVRSMATNLTVHNITEGVWTRTIRRNGGNVSALQELADAKTQAILANKKLDELLDRPAGSMTDAQVDVLAEKVGEQVALAIAPAVLDLMADRLKG